MDRFVSPRYQTRGIYIGLPLSEERADIKEMYERLYDAPFSDDAIARKVKKVSTIIGPMKCMFPSQVLDAKTIGCRWQYGQEIIQNWILILVASDK